MKNTGLNKIKEGLVEVKDGFKQDVKELELKSKVKGLFKKSNTEQNVGDEDGEFTKEQLQQHLKITKGFVEHFEKLIAEMEQEELNEDA